MAKSMTQKLAEVDIEKYEDVKNADKNQTFYDDYSAYSYLDSSMQASTNLGRAKSANISRSQGNRITNDSGFKFVKNKNESIWENEIEKNGKRNSGNKLDSSIPYTNSTGLFDGQKISAFSKGEETLKGNSGDGKTNGLGVINEVNEREFDSGRKGSFAGTREEGPFKEAKLGGNLREPDFL